MGLFQISSQKAGQEEHGALHSALSRAAPCLLPMGICAFHGAVLLQLCPSHCLHFGELKKAYLSPCSFKCRQAIAVAI